MCVCVCVCVQCPAVANGRQPGGPPSYGVISGQHRLAAVIVLQQDEPSFCEKFYDMAGHKNKFHELHNNNNLIMVPYYELMDNCPRFIVDFLLYQINSSFETTSTPNGVWDFLFRYK